MLKSTSLALLFLSRYVQTSEISVGVQANWTGAEFAIQLVEAASLHNESFYHLSCEALFGSTEGDSDWDNEFEAEAKEEIQDRAVEWPLSDRQCYDRLNSGLRSVYSDFVNLNLVNQMASPRIETHFSHFRNLVEPKLLLLVAAQCAQNSFGQTLDDPTSAWVKYGSRIYCSDEDLYALHLSSFSEELLPFDRVFGENSEAPLLVFYGHPSSERFVPMFNTLAQFAKSGNLRFVWRYMPVSDEKLTLYGYGTTFTVKDVGAAVTKQQEEVSSLEEFMAAHKLKPLSAINDRDLPEVGYKATALLLQSPISEQLSLLSGFVNHLPLYAPYLAKTTQLLLADAVIKAALRNERIGASSEMVGISVNGATVHRLETDLPHVIEKMRAEAQFVDDMNSLGFSTAQTKFLFAKNALRSAIKESEYGTGFKYNRFAVYKDLYDPLDSSSGGVVFFNNIETDKSYELLSPDPYEVYVENAGQIRVGQVPPLKENIHDLIFVINVSDKKQLQVFFAMSKIILDKGIPQQLGLLPLVSSEKERRIAALFYHLIEVGELQEAMALLYKYYESPEDKELELLDLVELPEDKYDDYANYRHTLEKFDIREPSIIVNGLIQDLRSSDWQTILVDQVSSDVNFLKSKILDGELRDLKELLHSNSYEKRNKKIFPQSPANIRYKRISQELVDNSFSLNNDHTRSDFGPTFWLIGDLNSVLVLDQLEQILRYMKKSKIPMQVRVFNSAKESNLSEGIEAFSRGPLTFSDFDQILKLIGDFHVPAVTGTDPKKLEILSNSQIQLHHPVILLNSRYLKLDKTLEVKDLELLVEYEFDQRLSIIGDIVSSYPEQFDGDLRSFVPQHCDPITWFDMVSSVVTNSIFLEDSEVRKDFGRFDFSSLSFQNLIDLTGYDSSKPLDVLIVIDPLDKFSQKLLSIAESLKDLSSVNLLVLIQPFSKIPVDVNVDRFYVSNYGSSIPRFDTEGKFSFPQTRTFYTESKNRFIVDIDAPSNWQYFKGNNSQTFDLDNLNAKENVSVNYTMSGLVVEAYVKDVSTAGSIPGLILEASSSSGTREAYTIQTKGYCQFLLEPGYWKIALKGKSPSAEKFDLLSATSNKYEINDQPLKTDNLLVHSLFSNKLHPRIQQKKGMKSMNAHFALKDLPTDQGVVNVFCATSGFTKEEFLAVLMKSVAESTSCEVKFWLLGNYLSNHLLHEVPLLAKKYKFQYQLVTYKWPLWLRQQTTRSRQLAAYKTLFLDVLFPSDVHKIVVIDADSLVLSDLSQVCWNLNGSAYGFVPMCEDRPLNQKFWHTGYWEKVLGDDLHYYSSAFYVVDLISFRESGVGEQLRRQYQKLSSDSNSLVILDQDLVNNLQRIVPIADLPSSWSWNPTWCSEKQKKGANVVHFDVDEISQSKAFLRAREVDSRWKPILDSRSLEIVHDEF